VRVVDDSPERMVVDVGGARTNGYVVVADAVVRPGWNATVDGSSAPLVLGNHAFGAVPVPAGSHRVVLSYTAPGLRLGAWTSGLALLLAAGMLAAPGFLRRRRGTGGPGPAGSTLDPSEPRDPTSSGPLP
jgi:hypothetical protein